MKNSRPDPWPDIPDALPVGQPPVVDAEDKERLKLVTDAVYGALRMEVDPSAAVRLTTRVMARLTEPLE